MPSRRTTLLLGLAVALAGCGAQARSAVPVTGAGQTRVMSGRLASGVAQVEARASSQAQAGSAKQAYAAPAAGKASKWTIQDLSNAEGRDLHAELNQGDLSVSPDLTPAEKALLQKLYAMPPGTSLKDQDLAPDHLKRAQMQSEFVYQHDGPYHRAIWRMADGAGRTLGYRVHSQPRDLLSGKYIVAFYGADSRLLFASPIWY